MESKFEMKSEIEARVYAFRYRKSKLEFSIKRLGERSRWEELESEETLKIIKVV